jgi:hypothetical protein
MWLKQENACLASMRLSSALGGRVVGAGGAQEVLWGTGDG